MGDPVDRDGEEARVRGDHLVDGFGGRVAGTDRLGVEDEAGVDLRQRFREGVDDARRVGLPGERCDETAQVAAGEDQAGGELVRARGGVVGELREEDAEQAVRERGDVALERVEAAVLGAARGEELRERVLAVVVGGRGHGLLRISGRCSGWAPGRRGRQAGRCAGRAGRRATGPTSAGRRGGSRRRCRLSRGGPGAQPPRPRGASPAARRPGRRRREPRPMKVAPRAWAKRGGYSCSSSAGGPRRRARRTAGQARPGRKRRVPNAAETARFSPTRSASHGSRREVGGGQDGGRDAGAEALAARVDPAGGRGEDGHRGPPGTRERRGHGSRRVRARDRRRVRLARPARGAGGQRAIATVPCAGSRRGQEQQVPLEKRGSRGAMAKS